MIIYFNRLLFLLLLIQLFFLNNINRGIFSDFNTSSILLFISYPEAKGNTVSSSELSEIMTYNFATNDLLQLTNDRFKDSHPSWSPDGKKIIFESRRPFKGDFAENGPSHLYLLELKTGNIRQLDKNFSKNYPGKIGEENMTPSWSATENKVAFVTRFSTKPEKTEFYLTVYDMEKNEAISVGRCSNPISLKWIGQKFLVYDTFVVSQLRTNVVIVNINTDQTIIIGSDKYSYSLVDVSKNNKKLLLQGRDTKSGEILAVIYDIETDSLNTLYNFGAGEKNISSFGLRANELIIQRGTLTENETTFNLYAFNLDSESYTQLTTNGKYKKNLSLFRSTH